ncbi:selenide, water dikinase [Sulfurovum riftiae]|uniref:Selenide, water dikinase n=2 Tax=Sulfurovum riftiae TaxID=1630136 RepID=A0A151CJH4_9BACT|nr:selenide, water dikinase [Sulfurovum riftiae]
MGPEDLKHTLCGLNTDNENLLVGFENSEDASVYQINDEQAMVQTLDFITPVVDDPYVYGKIAAANALSDVFAMGADVKTALNIVGFDKCNLPTEALGEILRGGNEKIKECGGVLMGGHTIESPEMYYGLSVTGLIHPEKIMQNNTARVGHVLILTKPLGTGILSTAIKRDLLNESSMEEAAKVMQLLNYMPSVIMREYDVSACTDVTGFGLLGHGLECMNDEISFHIDSASLPILPDAFKMAELGAVPGGSKRNMKHIEEKVLFKGDNVEDTKLILSDAQTSGGLLISMDEKDAKEYLKRIEDICYGYATIIGRIEPKGEKDIIVF